MYKREVKEEAPGVYRFSEPMGQRLLNFYGIKEENGWTLVDCGLPDSVASRVSEGVISGNINKLVITHQDADHFGSAAWLRANYPKLEIICHSEDKNHIENHQLIVKNRYDVARPVFGFGYPQEILDILLTICGGDFEVDRTIQHNDTMLIAGDEWVIYHLPGHSSGHIGMVRPKDGVFIMGDAFLADGPPDKEGVASMPPTHESVLTYLKSIDFAKTIDVSIALSGHWPALDKNAFVELLDKSCETVFRDIDIITSFLEEGEKSFGDILGELNKQVSTWENEEDYHYLYAVNGYLQHLESLDKVTFTPQQKIKLARK